MNHSQMAGVLLFYPQWNIYKSRSRSPPHSSPVPQISKMFWQLSRAFLCPVAHMSILRFANKTPMSNWVLWGMDQHMIYTGFSSFSRFKWRVQSILSHTSVFGWLCLALRCTKSNQGRLLSPDLEKPVIWIYIYIYSIYIISHSH